MDSTNINADELISLVQERSVLWDKTLNEYKDKQLKISAWREVCCQLIPNFDDLNEKERKTHGKLISTKWAHLRDSWIRYNKCEVKTSGAGAKGSRPYIHYEQMRFLKKVAEPNKTHDSVSNHPIETYTEARSMERDSPSTSKRQKQIDLDEKMGRFLDSRLSANTSDEHPMLSFFKGVLPSVASFDGDETLEFQSGMLGLIKKIKEQRENRSHYLNSWQSQSSRDHIQQPVYSPPPENRYLMRQPTQSASPCLSQFSTYTQESELSFVNF